MEKWEFKDIIKTMTIGGLIFPIMILPFSISVDWKIEKGSLLYYYIPLYIISIIILHSIYYIIKIINKRNEKKTESYFRYIEDKYSPAIISYILDYTIEKKATVLSTILDLSVRGYLNIKKINSEYIIEVTEKKIEDLYFHERYIITCISNNKLIEFDKFSELIKFDCKKELLVKDKKNIRGYIFILIVILLDLTILIINDINFHLINEYIDLAMFLISIIIIFILSKTIRNQNRTLKGERLATKAKGLKNFLKDYTLINEKDIDYTKITDRYLGFAIAINEAKNMEKLYIDNSEFLSRYIKMEGVENYERTN